MGYYKNHADAVSHKLLNAILFLTEPDNRYTAIKYHNIKDTPPGLDYFQRKMKELRPNATHINYYDRETRAFVRQYRYDQSK